jgi:hypothetical protein
MHYGVIMLILKWIANKFFGLKWLNMGYKSSYKREEKKQKEKKEKIGMRCDKEVEVTGKRRHLYNKLHYFRFHLIFYGD